ncbi:EAL domain-containing protein [Luteimonas sp. RD2P54]|uniref:EAL domain-containing protein n=1 Tax=Luteimonas endophytica TaxID=3042023 RepID=A0ABT6J7D4_9GAMM|nr:EAL domain-containing protein [Luteimonas endophytica]MDH5822737.1 EAL domain-containing protein [Luteimonas endophytica]
MRPLDHVGVAVEIVPRLGAGHPDLVAMVGQAVGGGAALMVLHIDIEHFASINQNMGVEVGDQALRLLAERLAARIGERGRLWRHGSDEFVAAVPYPAGSAPPRELAEELLREVELPLSVLPYTLFLNARIGMSLCPLQAAEASLLLQQAETAVRQASHHDSDPVQLYAVQASEKLQNETIIARQIVDAAPNGELRMRYQPKVSARDGRVVGMEALLRWQSPDLGLLLPERFMPTAERLGVIVQIGHWVLDRVVEQARAWREQGFDDFFIGVNVSTLQLLDPEFVNRLLTRIGNAGLPNSTIVLEANESALTYDVNAVHEAIKALRHEGVGLSLDNFGTGDSSLSALVRYPADRLKIDRSFINSAPAGSRETAIVRAIIAMGHQLGMKVIANGVETEAQLGFLRRSDCDEFQGYLFGEPMNADAAGQVLRRRYLRPELFAAATPDRTLLLVDDEENVLRSLVRLFRRDGYRILAAGNVRDAFGLLATNDVQVILSDQRMSEMDGTEFLGRVKMLYPDTIRLVLSGYTDLATVTDAINRGAIYRFLTKPWDDRELREHIRQAFATYGSQRARDGALSPAAGGPAAPP